jgi:3' terminal RNA ribose 2'-O-methyltransferase Hen1
VLLTIATTHQPATDLGYLLHKHPDRCQSFELPFGLAKVFYPEAAVDRCTMALLLDIDPVSLVRGKSSSLDQYVNDRPYVASSFLSVAISKLFNTAMGGRCKDREALAATPLPLTVNLPVLPCRGGEKLLRQLFEPLGYQVTATALPLDEQFADWGNSPYFAVELTHTLRLAELLGHLYVLIPVLDNDKHYWVGDEEVAKLLRHGEGWLDVHPEREQIVRRYLKRQRQLARLAMEQLTIEAPPAEDDEPILPEEAIEKPQSLNQQRLETVQAVLKELGVKRVVDLGCGEGKLLRLLLKDPAFEQVTGMDVSYRCLERARERLERDYSLATHQSKLQLFQGSLTYRDDRLQGFEGATLIEVIEHMDLDRLAALERVLFEFAAPPVVIITTPNVEFNVLFPSLPGGQLRHGDHRFEWTRAEFQSWSERVAERFGYKVEFRPIGAVDLELGAATQMGVFTKCL